MHLFIRNIIWILLLCIGFSCNKKPEINFLSNRFYNTKVDLQINHLNSNYLYLKGLNKIAYITDKSLMIFKSSDIEILYSLSNGFAIKAMKENDKRLAIQKNYKKVNKRIFISIKNIDSTYKAFFIIWHNKDTLPSNSLKNFLLDINEKTDSVYTNIPKYNFFYMFPKFNGTHQEISNADIKITNRFKKDSFYFYWYDILFNNMENIYLFDKSTINYNRKELDNQLNSLIFSVKDEFNDE